MKLKKYIALPVSLPQSLSLAMSLPIWMACNSTERTTGDRKLQEPSLINASQIPVGTQAGFKPPEVLFQER